MIVTLTRQQIGALAWIASLQYYLVQIIVAVTWNGRGGFSWLHNTISDLGNTACAQYGARYVCSPLHPLMNTSFIVLGLTMIGGAVLLARSLRAYGAAKLGFYLLIIAGAGTILVGLFPENTVSAVHLLGAALPFVLGNLAMILIGLRLNTIPKLLRVVSFALGSLGLIALVLLLTKTYLSLDFGGIERLVAYPQSIWMILLGIYCLRSKLES